MTTCPHTITVGCYLLGALDEREREQFRQHAAGCSSCRQEITELLPVIRGLHQAKACQEAAGLEAEESDEHHHQ